MQARCGAGEKALATFIGSIVGVLVAAVARLIWGDAIPTWGYVAIWVVVIAAIQNEFGRR